MNSRFTLACHILTYLAYAEAYAGQVDKRFVSSSALAVSTKSHPVVVRRILSQLQKSKLIKTSAGVTGGAQLNRRPDKITLLDVYLSITEKDDNLFATKKISGNPACPIGSQFRLGFKSAMTSIEDRLKYALSLITVEHLLNSNKSVSTAPLVKSKQDREDPLPIFLY